MDKHEQAELKKILRILEKHWGEKLTPDLIEEITQTYSTFNGRYELRELVAPYEKEELGEPPVSPFVGESSRSIFRTIILLFLCLTIFVLAAQYLPFDEQTPFGIKFLLIILSLICIVSLLYVETKTENYRAIYPVIVLFMLLAPICLLSPLTGKPLIFGIFSQGENNVLDFIVAGGLLASTLAASQMLSSFFEDVNAFFWSLFKYQIKSKSWFRAIIFFILAVVFFVIYLVFEG